MPASVTVNISLRMQTDLEGVDIELFDTQAPLTVANFLNYVIAVTTMERSSIAACRGSWFRAEATSSMEPRVVSSVAGQATLQPTLR
jgi:hypothetical protein